MLYYIVEVVEMELRRKPRRCIRRPGSTKFQHCCLRTGSWREYLAANTELRRSLGMDVDHDGCRKKKYIVITGHVCTLWKKTLAPTHGTL